MNQTVEYINKLKDTNSRLKKEAILQEAWEAGERDLFTCFQLAYNARKPFYVKKVPKATDAATLFAREELPLQTFIEKIERLHSREVTGYDAMELVVGMMEDCDVSLWNELYRRILLKDLKCGTTSTTVNKVLKKISKTDPEAEMFYTPVFKCALADDHSKHEKKMVGEKYVDVKLDGVRLLVFVDAQNDTVMSFTRNGKINENFPHVEQFLLAAAGKHFQVPMVLDGEIMGEDFRKLMTQINRKENVDTSDSIFYIFDAVPIEDFERGKCNIPLKKRHELLVNFKNQMVGDDAPVHIVEKKLMNVEEPEFFEFWERKVEEGYEGVMVKDPDSPYVCKKSAYWLKKKPFIEVTLSVEGFYEGEGKHKGRLGGLICKGKDEGYYIEVDCGGGFTEEEREEIWAIKDTNLIGRLVEVRADGISQNKDSKDVYSLRFPRFKGFRGAVPGEKI